MLISASGDLLVLFLGLELMVLPGYLLAGFAKHDALSTEGAIKYFLLGSFSSAIFLFGLAFIWGLTGTTRIDGVSTALGGDRGRLDAADPGPGHGPGLPDHRGRLQDRRGALPLLDAGRLPGLAHAGHRLPLDRAQGRRVRPDPAPVRRTRSGPLSADWNIVIVVLAALTMTLGNLVALSQDSVKRMLAYSSIAHTGYMLIGLAAWSSPNSQIAGPRGPALLRRGLRGHEPGRLRGGGGPPAPDGDLEPARDRSPAWVGASRSWRVLMTLFLLSLTGIPPTAGFFAKAYVILAAVEAGGPAGILAIIAVLNAAIAAFYYLRVVVYMFMRESKGEPAPVVIGRLMRTGLIVSALLTVVLGVLPELLLPVVERAAKALTQ